MWREFERTSTTVMQRRDQADRRRATLATSRQRSADAASPASVLIMQSNGGVMSAHRRSRPAGRDADVRARSAA